MNNADLRLHIASLSAVFLALGIGIIIGTAFVGTPIVTRQTGLIKRLETHVDTLRDETREQERTEDALKRLVPRLVRGTLTGKRVLVVQMGGYPDSTAAVMDTLKTAGALPFSVVLPPDGWRGRLSRPDVTADTLAEEARRLAPRLSADATDLWQPYRDSGELTDGAPSDGDADGPAHYVVLVGGEAASGDITLLEQRDLPLIQTWQSAGLTVVGVEPMNAAVSYIPTYRNAGIATIDAIDHSAGKIALPYALRGEQAAYGYGPEAERILPASLEAEPSPSPSPSPTPAPTPAPQDNP